MTMPRIPGLYMSAHELIVGDLIVHENCILEIGRIKQPARFYKGQEPAQLPIFELWTPGDVSGKPVSELRPPCIDTMIRVRSARGAVSRG